MSHILNLYNLFRNYSYPPTPTDARGSAPGNKTSKFSRTSSKSSGSGCSSGSSESSYYDYCYYYYYYYYDYDYYYYYYPYYYYPYYYYHYYDYYDYYYYYYYHYYYYYYYYDYCFTASEQLTAGAGQQEGHVDKLPRAAKSWKFVFFNWGFRRDARPRGLPLQGTKCHGVFPCVFQAICSLKDVATSCSSRSRSSAAEQFTAGAGSVLHCHGVFPSGSCLLNRRSSKSRSCSSSRRKK